ncbi:MAG: hypothetical protein KME46_15565 [Brasilonema angustatum HA4187-MV1]|jgi:hypothetical protein|nr:hypothetical protein [Brasilonema angustatum HA4187-MV1]
MTHKISTYETIQFYCAIFHHPESQVFISLTQIEAKFFGSSVTLNKSGKSTKKT